jgi:hypothetical protein
MAFITHSPDHIYFATDGSWGHAEGMIVLDTNTWQEEDFRRVEEASDEDRIDVAFAIANEKGQRNG